MTATCRSVQTQSLDSCRGGFSRDSVLRRARSRLKPLLQGLSLAFALLFSTLAPAKEFETNPFDVEFSELAPGVWLAQRPISARQPVIGNGVIILNGDHVVVVDGAGAVRTADQVIARIRELTDLPVKYLVISHWHGDHNLGAHRYKEAWPGLEIVGHRFTRQAMLGAPMDYVAEYKENLGEYLDGIAPLLEADELPDGRPLGEGRRRYLGDSLEWRDELVADMQASEVTPPTLTFEDHLVLHGERRIDIKRFGNGNTQGDAVTWLPGERILITGDVVVHPTPYGFYSYPREWAQVLRELIALDPKLIVSGHGGPLRDTQYLEDLIALFEDVANQVEPLVAEGLDLEQVRERVDLSAHKAKLAGDDDWLLSRFDAWFATPIVEAAYNVAAGVENEQLERVEADDSAAEGGS